jgi:hypothetical protein
MMWKYKDNTQNLDCPDYIYGARRPVPFFIHNPLQAFKGQPKLVTGSIFEKYMRKKKIVMSV